MKSVRLRVLKSRLHEYVRLAQRGETVLVTEGDNVVARIVPPEPGGATRASDAVMLDLIRRGVMSPPLVVSADPPPSYGTASWEAVKAGLAADRSD